MPIQKLIRRLAFLLFPVLICLGCNSSLLGQITKYHRARTWTDSTGKHKTEASLVSSNGTVVILALKNNETKTLPFDRLSKKDQDFITDYGNATFATLKSQAQNSIYATDALELYETYVVDGLVSPKNKVYVESQIELLKEKSESNSIIINRKYIPFDELPKLKAQSLADTNNWVTRFAAMGEGLSNQKLIKKAMSEDPTSLESLVTLALLYEIGGAHPKNVQRHLERAIERGERYLPIATKTDKQNLAAALNNLAVSYAKEGKISKSIKIMKKIKGLSETDIPTEVLANVEKIKKMIARNSSGLSADIGERKTVAEFSNLIGSNSSSSAWELMVPQKLSSISFAVDERFASIEGKTIRDKRCIKCAGTSGIFCTAKACKKGAVKNTIWGPKYVQGNIVGREIKEITYVPCTVCKGKGTVPCSGCHDSRTRLSTGVQD